MTDEDCGAVFQQLAYPSEDLVFAFGVHGAGWFIHDQLHKIERQERHRTPRNNKGQVGYRPTRPRLPHKAQRAIKSQ